MCKRDRFRRLHMSVAGEDGIIVVASQRKNRLAHLIEHACKLEIILSGIHADHCRA